MDDIQAIVAQHSMELDEHERRISSLEKGQDAIRQQIGRAHV